MFAAIQSAEPTALILWSLLAFAAGMYPVGLMLGSTCSPCCGTPCTQCTQGSLPDTVTVTLSGFPNQNSSNRKTCCGDFYNGKTVVLTRGFAGSPCLYSHALCGLQRPGGGVGSSDADALARITLSYQGPTLPPLLTLTDDGLIVCTATLTATQNVTNCSDFTFTLTNASGATAQVVPGGTYDAAFLMPGGHACYICCKGEEPFASPAEFTIQDNRGQSTNISGTYVVPFRQIRGDEGRGEWLQGFGNVVITVELLACGSQFATPDMLGRDRSGWTPYFLGFQGFGPGSTPVFCDECHNKCHFRVRVSALADDGWSLQVWVEASTWFPTCDSECEDTPICNPYGRSWVLCLGPTDCGSIVVTA